MYLALLLLICLLVVLFNAWRGWRSGALAQLFTLGALLVSYAAAGLIICSGYTEPFLRPVPRLLQPYVLATLAAVLLYAVLASAARAILRHWDARAAERQRDAHYSAAAAAAPDSGPHPAPPLDPRPISRSPANRRWGAVVGGLHGLVVAGVLLLAVQLLGSIAVALVPRARAVTAAAPPERPRAGSDQSATLRPAPSPVQSIFQRLGEELRKTPVGAMADAVAPVKQKQIEAAGTLSRLSESPRAMARLRSQPQIRALINDPRVQALGNDTGIMKAVREQRWTDLLNHPAIAALARDPAIQRKLRTLNLDELAKEMERAARSDAARDAAGNPTRATTDDTTSGAPQSR